MISDKVPTEHETVRWQWFLECSDCGKVHPWRWITPPDALSKQGTWADEDDGHVYRPRLSPGEIGRLYQEWEMSRRPEPTRRTLSL